MESLFFVVWLICTGMAGYIFGRTPLGFIQKKCPPVPPPKVIKKSQRCDDESNATKPFGEESFVTPESGYSYDEIKRLWSCSRAKTNFTGANKKLLPKGGKLEKTKWKSVISVDPKPFFDKYLSQYPGDMAAIQPVIVFSHKPLKDFESIPTVCKVLDVAIIPDTPGVCVAVTETFHDVASYHMLHADKQSDGSFALTANALEGRDIPTEKHYAASRALLLQYFAHQASVASKVKHAPKFGKTAIGCLIEEMAEVPLFLNAVESAARLKVPKQKFCVFTTVSAIKDQFTKANVKVIYLPELVSVGLEGDADVGSLMRRHFIHIWLAFAVADEGLMMLWQSPGTVWLNKPDYMIAKMPPTETIWSYKGRTDRRAAPFYCSLDLVLLSKEDRAVHLLHELMLHFDLVLAWGSIDAVAAYRLSENNSRYGSTTYIMPPELALHTDLLGGDAARLREAIADKGHPYAIALPYRLSPSETKELLQSTGLWFLK